MIVNLIRHGKTRGELFGQYIGSTDEPLCTEGISELRLVTPPEAKIVVSSTMKRCIESAAILYPEQQVLTIDGLEECDFGEFEGKAFEDVRDTEEYENWLESCGELAFPGGEKRSVFSDRCADTFSHCVYDLLDVGAPSCTFVVHDGTIMSILEHFAEERKEYYLWQSRHCHGFMGEIDDSLWIRNIREI